MVERRMSGVLGARFACAAAEETSRGAVARWSGMLFLALVFVLCGSMCVGSTVIANLSVGRAVAFVDVVSETVASTALEERFWGNCDL